MKIKIDNNKVKPNTFAKRLFYLLWQASPVVGMGAFQDRGQQPEDTVWERAVTDAEYAGARPCPAGEVYGDYVFGRMMKTGFDWTGVELTVSDLYTTPAPDYQGWARKYPSIVDAIKETAKQLDVTVEFA